MLLSRRAKERSRLRQDGLRSLLSYVKKLINEERRDASREYLSKCVAVAEWMLEWDEPLRKKRMKKRHKPKGSKKHATRCRKRGLPRSYGREMSIESIGERDGWVCQLCMWPIEDRESRKSPLSPCVDHIVPLNHQANTRHGHTLQNVQVAHRRCNEAKGCSVACETLLHCESPREWLVTAGITQRKGGWQKMPKTKFARGQIGRAHV
jgi:5-methylcytosine-specific restriction endonuclease McrA